MVVNICELGLKKDQTLEIIHKVSKDIVNQQVKEFSIYYTGMSAGPELRPKPNKVYAGDWKFENSNEPLSFEELI
jgi:hypothetical protein